MRDDSKNGCVADYSCAGVHDMLDPILGYRYFETLRLVATMPRNVELLCNCCMYFSNTVNPFIYAGMNPIFRREFRKILCCAQRRNAVGVSARVVPTIQEGRQGSTLPVVFTSERS